MDHLLLLCHGQISLIGGQFLFMWSIFKVFIKFVTMLLLLYVLVFWPWLMWNLSSLTKDWTCTPCIGKRSLNHWAAREVLNVFLYLSNQCLGFHEGQIRYMILKLHLQTPQSAIHKLYFLLLLYFWSPNNRTHHYAELSSLILQFIDYLGPLFSFHCFPAV